MPYSNHSAGGGGTSWSGAHATEAQTAPAAFGHALPGDDYPKPSGTDQAGQELFLHPILRFARGFVGVKDDESGPGTLLEYIEDVSETLVQLGVGGGGGTPRSWTKARTSASMSVVPLKSKRPQASSGIRRALASIWLVMWLLPVSLGPRIGRNRQVASRASRQAKASRMRLWSAMGQSSGSCGSGQENPAIKGQVWFGVREI